MASATSMEEYFALRTKVNRQQLRFFAAGICSLVAVFILAHWLRVVFNKLSPSSTNPIRTVSRFVRSVLVRKAPGLPSRGHALVVASYLAINLAVLFTHITINVANIANRCGWLVVANFCVVVFLALKNTPLAVLTAYSYERLNILHQIAGYLTFIFLVLHASMYTKYFLAEGLAAYFEQGSLRAGIVAGFAFLGLMFSGGILRNWWYEAFLASHILCFLAALVAASLHQPDLAENGLLIMLALIAGLWGADRLVRGTRMLLNSRNSYAVIEPLPHGGTRIVLDKAPLGAAPGKHCFVWLPAIRRFESHPFTVAATGPVEFIVHAYDGFTRDLHEHAVRSPGARLRVSVDGPYGTLPDPSQFDRVVLIAGGSGATFTMGVASSMLEKMGPDASNHIVFIWVVKKHANLSWLAGHLQTLRAHPHSPNVTTSLYVSESEASSSSSASSSKPTDHTPSYTSDAESYTRSGEKAATPTSPTFPSGDPEKDPAAAHFRPARPSEDSPDHGHAVRSGRPDTAALIREAVAATPATGRVLVAACGPDVLLRDVRAVTAGLIRGDGPGVELHCEKFGW